MSASIYSTEPAPKPEATAEAAPETSSPVEPKAPERGKRKSRRLLYLCLLAAVAVAAWFSLDTSSAFDGPELVYLPDNAAVIVHLDAGRFSDSKLLNDLRELTEQMAGGVVPGGSIENLTKLNESLETVTVGVVVPDGGGPPEIAGVLRCGQDLVFREVLPPEVTALRSGQEEIDGKSLELYGEGALCQIDNRTIVFGDPAGVRKVLQRGSASPAVSDAMREALGQADFSKHLTVVAAGAPAGVQQLKQFIGVDPPSAIVVNANVDEDIDLTASFVMRSASDVEAVQSRAQPFLQMAKMQSPEAAEVLDSLEFSTSGTTLAVSVKVPGPPLVELARTSAAEQLGLRSLAAGGAGMAAAGVRPGLMSGGTVRLPGNLTAGAAGAAACQHRLAELNSAIERYYFDKGDWPQNLDPLAAYLSPSFPRTCPTHGAHYVIDPESHRAIESVTPAPDSGPEVAAADSASRTPDASEPLEPAESPRAAFEMLLASATEGNVLELLRCFTEHGQFEIVRDLTSVAMKDIAIQTYQKPAIAKEFQEIQAKAPPTATRATQVAELRAQVEYLRSVADFMRKHQIEFSELASMYEPCTLGKVVIDGSWAIGQVGYDKDGVVAATTLGFAGSPDGWHVCSLAELPEATLLELRERLDEQLAESSGSP